MTGDAFRRLGVRELVEEDFFAWVIEARNTNDALSLLEGLAQHLSVYDFGALSEDLLKELYQELVDPTTRHDLGEFYTPDWLAERTLREADFSQEKSLLAPACGSGTFLFTAIRMLREQGLKGESLVQHAGERLAGLDVHPLAVIIARCNFVLALAPDLRAQAPVKIPIYMADALLKADGMESLIPVPVAGLTEEEAKQHHLERAFHLPAILAHDGERMEDAIRALVEMSRVTGEEEAAEKGLRSRLEKMGLTDWIPVFQNNLRLLRHLVQTGRDTVYAFVLRNAYRPEVLAHRRFDLVAGNPPWLAYRDIKGASYKRWVKQKAQAYGLVDSREVRLFTQMEMATLFFAHAWERYLADGGTIAFVMPRSVLTGAQQHRRFRELFGGKLATVLDLGDSEAGRAPVQSTRLRAPGEEGRRESATPGRGSAWEALQEKRLLPGSGAEPERNPGRAPWPAEAAAELLPQPFH